ncbi:hypothetical protein VSW52_04530, partial (plasmid) [Borreliella burgdorferi]
ISIEHVNSKLTTTPMKKYLGILEKLKVVVKLSFDKDTKSIIYYKINCPLEKISLTTRLPNHYQID